MKQTKEEFIADYVANSQGAFRGLTWDELSKYKVVLPCHCDYEPEPHWAMVPNDPDAIADHMMLYGEPA